MPQVWLRNAQRFECLPNRHELPECAKVEKGEGGAKEISQEPADLVELGGKSGGQMGQRFATEMSEAVTPQNWS